MDKKDSPITIIDNPKLLTLPRIVGEWGVTTVMWLFWIYLLLPVISILLWMLGIHFFYQEVVYKAGYKHFLILCKNLGLTILIVFIILRAWGYYNYLAFGKRNRRKVVRSTNPAELGELFNLSPDEVLYCQARKEITWPLNRR